MRVALGVGGGIAAYKAPEIVRGLFEGGADVRVILTRNGARFVTGLTLQTLSGSPVLLDVWDERSDAVVAHVELVRDLDALVVAPCTANLLAKFARGIADDFLTTLFTAMRGPVVLAPAMNTRMWLHEPTRENVATLRARGVRVLEPDSGWLAEREQGVGRMPDPEAIVAETLRAARRTTALAGRRVLVTAGPTREAIDPVRFVSNRSSGRMGFALADAAARRGADVTLVCGPVDLPTPFGVERVDVETAAEMRDATIGRATDADLVFMVAAVADFVPRAAEGKIKKSALAARGEDDGLTVRMDPAPDILAELGAHPVPGRVVVGFAAETDDVERHAREKLVRKGAGVDFIVANDVSRAGIGMDATDNAVTILAGDGSAERVERAPKGIVAEAILDRVSAACEVASTEPRDG